MTKAKLNKRLQAVSEDIDDMKLYSVDEAVALLKKSATTKFNETVDIVFNLGVDPKHSDQMVRGMTSLPNGLGKEQRVAVFAKGDKATEAQEAGADFVGEDDLVELFNEGKVDVDRCIATPDMMAKVGTLGRVLGPKGLMPNPKLGTVTINIKEAVKTAKSGQVEYKVEKNGIIHAGIGKTNFDEKTIKENLCAFADAVIQAKPSGAKGTYLKRVAVSTTMGLSIKLDTQDLLTEVRKVA